MGIKAAPTRNVAVLTSTLAHNAAGHGVTAPVALKHAKKANLVKILHLREVVTSRRYVNHDDNFKKLREEELKQK